MKGGNVMETFAEFIAQIEDPNHRERTKEVLDWVTQKYPQMQHKIGWNQPMFTDHGTFIIGFSVSKKHLAVSTERAGIAHFSDEIIKAGYEHSNNLMRFPWEKPIDYVLLQKMIEFNISEKADITEFWRKSE
jgi:uncharacterized protein YdhG (YjbR/CyaY superfamily)